MRGQRRAKPATLRPDHPPTQAFASYPNLQTVGFHYANPVTNRSVRYPSGAVTRAKPVTASLAGAPPLTSATGGPAVLADVQRELERAIGFDATEKSEQLLRLLY